jgi:NADPH:quinone reductase-like Zn-dependent oxidoreductase
LGKVEASAEVSLRFGRYVLRRRLPRIRLRVKSSANPKRCQVESNPTDKEMEYESLITGATGYIGGSVAERLHTSGYAMFGLVRSKEKAPLLKECGIDAVVGTPGRLARPLRCCTGSEAVIHAASADDADSVLTLVGALERTGKPLIYTTGSSIVADSADGEVCKLRRFYGGHLL